MWVSPLSFTDWIELMIAAARFPARIDPAKSHLGLPRATGRMRFSMQLLSIGRSPSSMYRISAAQRLRLSSIAFAVADPSGTFRR